MGRSRERQSDLILSWLGRLWSRRRGPSDPRGHALRDHSRQGLSDEKAAHIALAVTHEVREEMGRGREPEERLPAPSPGEVRKRREERRTREDEGYY